MTQEIGNFIKTDFDTGGSSVKRGARQQRESAAPLSCVRRGHRCEGRSFLL